jgi:hypothetical protein
MCSDMELGYPRLPAAAVSFQRDPRYLPPNKTYEQNPGLNANGSLNPARIFDHKRVEKVQER